MFSRNWNNIRFPPVLLQQYTQHTPQYSSTIFSSRVGNDHHQGCLSTLLMLDYFLSMYQYSYCCFCVYIISLDDDIFSILSSACPLYRVAECTSIVHSIFYFCSDSRSLVTVLSKTLKQTVRFFINCNFLYTTFKMKHLHYLEEYYLLYTWLIWKIGKLHKYGHFNVF